MNDDYRLGRAEKDIEDLREAKHKDRSYMQEVEIRLATTEEKISALERGRSSLLPWLTFAASILAIAIALLERGGHA